MGWGVKGEEKKNQRDTQGKGMCAVSPKLTAILKIISNCCVLIQAILRPNQRSFKLGLIIITKTNQSHNMLVVIRVGVSTPGSAFLYANRLQPVITPLLGVLTGTVSQS